MIKSALIRTAIAVSLGCSLSAPAFANEDNSEALALAGQKQFEQALALLSQQDAAAQSGYEHRFLRARILSWAGKYDEAENELNALMSAYPDNPDLQLAAGNLQYYQGNSRAAETYYQTVLDAYPDYEDARTGLENVRRAQAAAIDSPSQRWRIDGSLGLSNFSETDLSDWDDQFLRVEYTPDQFAFHGSVQRYSRFDETDIELKAGISDAIRGGWDWGVEAGFTPSAVFRPDFSLGGRLGRSIETQNGITVYPTVSYRYDDYASGTIHNIAPELTAYMDNGLVLTGRLIGTLQDGESDQLGWLLQGRKRISDRIEINAGYANAPEAINGLAISTESLFGGLTYSVSEDLDIHLNLGRDDREDTYIRKGVNVGFTHKR